MRDLGEIATRQLPAIVEGCIEVTNVDFFDQFLESLSIPSIDIWTEENRFTGPFDSPGNGIGELVPMFDGDGSYLDPWHHLGQKSVLHLRDDNLLQLDELTPRTILLQETPHPLGAIHVDGIGRSDFSTELDQSGVMTDVSMGEKYRIYRASAFITEAGDFPQQGELFLDCGSCCAPDR